MSTVFESIDEAVWNQNPITGVYESTSKGFNSLAYLIDTMDGGLRILEVGPISTFWYSRMKLEQLAYEHVAPIKLVHERYPQIQCASIGTGNKLPADLLVSTLGEVPFVYGILCPYNPFNVEEVIEVLGGAPDIIYGQHVFESSSETPTLPVGPYKPFEKSAELVREGGYIVVDNHGGSEAHIGIHTGWPNSKRMKPLYKLEHGDIGEGVFVFRKD